MLAAFLKRHDHSHCEIDCGHGEIASIQSGQEA